METLTYKSNIETFDQLKELLRNNLKASCIDFQVFKVLAKLKTTKQLEDLAEFIVKDEWLRNHFVNRMWDLNKSIDKGLNIYQFIVIFKHLTNGHIDPSNYNYKFNFTNMNNLRKFYNLNKLLLEFS